jgi:hypothetical protein
MSANGKIAGWRRNHLFGLLQELITVVLEKQIAAFDIVFSCVSTLSAYSTTLTLPHLILLQQRAREN